MPKLSLKLQLACNANFKNHILRVFIKISFSDVSLVASAHQERPIIMTCEKPRYSRLIVVGVVINIHT